MFQKQLDGGTSFISDGGTKISTQGDGGGGSMKSGDGGSCGIKHGAGSGG